MGKLALTAVVLAGGKSTRLGQDKAFALVGGRPMVERVLEVVRQVCDEILILGGDGGKLKADQARHLPDEHPGEGPLMALRTGLAAMTHDWAFATACDAPFLEPRLLEYLWTLREGHDAVVPFTAADNYPKPLCALYARRCLPAATAALDRGDRQLVRLYRDVRVLYVPEDNLRLIDPDLRSFLNVNTAEDLRRAEEIAAETD